jgi:hypothetical protein
MFLGLLIRGSPVQVGKGELENQTKIKVAFCDFYFLHRILKNRKQTRKRINPDKRGSGPAKY